VTREWRRLLVAPERLAGCGGRVALLAEESHYLRRVLRLRGGEQLAVLDGRGRLWSARLELAAESGGSGRGREGDRPSSAVLEQPLTQPLHCEPAPTPALELAVAMPRLDGDVLLRMVCELGIDRFTPLQAARSVAERSKPQRQQAILREAVEQCERLWQPELAPEQGAGDWFASSLAAGAELRLLATTRHHDLPLLEELLLEPVAGGLRPEPPRWIRLAIGPEGGWTPAEEERAAAAGWRPVSLGTTILRSSTAAVAAAAWLAAWRRRLGGEGQQLRF
jgi:16S rRNA (uracil1498-N3)-methyltransferase